MTVDIRAVAGVVATMFLLMLAGYTARKLRFIDDKSSKMMSDLIIRVGQPFMIIGAILGVPYSNDNLLKGGLILVIGIIIHAVAAVIAFIATFKMRDAEERRLTEFSATFTNCGFLGLPLLRAAYGDVGAFWGAFFIIIFNLICWTYGIYVLSRASEKIKINPLKIFVNFGTVPCVVGLVLYVARAGDVMPPVIFDAMHYLGSICTPLSMLITGGLLATIPLGKLFTNARIYILCAVKLLVLPVICGLVLAVLRFPYELTMFGTMMASLPTGTNAAIFAESYDIKPSYGAHAVGMTTLLSVLTIPTAVFAVDALIRFLGIYTI